MTTTQGTTGSEAHAAPGQYAEMWLRGPDGVRLHAWHFTGSGDALATPAGRPVVVMAHGLGGTKDSGLAPFAERLAAAGLDVLAFDYRGFGASEGEPRQTVSMAGQLDDYRAR